MAFKTTVSYELIRKIISVLIVLPLVATSNIDCGGKAFHCVNSTHFMICVDLGGGVSSTMDGFVIPCPPSTACQETNHFECEFPRTMTVLPTTETSVPSELIQSNFSVVTESAIITTTANEISEVQSTDIILNTVSTTTITDDSFTAHQVTESVTVANSATIDFTTIGYTLETVSNEYSATTYTNDITTSNPSDVRYSHTETTAPIYQNTVATLVVNDVTNTNKPIMPDSISTTYKPTLDQTATEPLTVNNMVNSFTTETYTTIYNELYTDVNEVVDNNSITVNAVIGNEQLQSTTTELIDTTVGTTTTAENIGFTNMDTVTTESYAEAISTETQQLLDYTTSGIGTDLSEVINTENVNIFENLILTEPNSTIAVTEEHTTLSETLQSTLSTVVHPDLELGTTESSYYIDKISTTKDYNNIIAENMSIISEITYDTATTNPITQKHNFTEAFTEDPWTNIALENEDKVFTANSLNLETTASSIVPADKDTSLDQETGVLTQNKSTLTTESNSPTPISVTVTSNQLATSENIGEYQTTLPYSEPSAIIDTKRNIASTDETIPTNETVSLNTTGTSNFNISDVTAASTASIALDTGVTITDDSTSTLRSVTEGSDGIIKEYSFTEFTESVPFVGLPSMEPSILESDIFGSVKDSTVLEFATALPDMETGSTIIDTSDGIFTQTSTSIKVSDSRQDITNSMLSTETIIINSHLTNVKVKPQAQIDVGTDQPLYTSVTNVPTKDQENKYISGSDQKSTTIPVAQTVDGTIAVNTDSNINENYMVKHITDKTKIIEQQLIGNVVSTVSALEQTIYNTNGSIVTEKVVQKSDTTEDIESVNNAHQVEKITMEKPQTKADIDSQNVHNADIGNQNVYNVTTSVSLSVSTPDYYQTNAQGGETVTTTVSIPLSAASLLKDNIQLSTQKSIGGSEILQTTTTEFDAISGTNINTKTKHVSGTTTPAILTEIILDTSDLRKKTLNQGATEINFELKSDGITTTESDYYSRNNEIVMNLPQMAPEIINESDFNVNNYPTTNGVRDIPYQLENSVLQTLPESPGNLSESTREVTLEEKHLNNGIRNLIYQASDKSDKEPIVTEATKIENIYYVTDPTQISTDASAALINNEKAIAGYDSKLSTVSDINIENEQINKNFNKPSTSLVVENKEIQQGISLSASPFAKEQNQNNPNIVKSFIDAADKGSQQEIGLFASQVADEQNLNNPIDLKTPIVTANNEFQQEIGLSARQVTTKPNQNNPNIVKSTIVTVNEGVQQEIGMSASQVTNKQNQNIVNIFKTSTGLENKESHQEIGLSASQVASNHNVTNILKPYTGSAKIDAQPEIGLIANQVVNEQTQNKTNTLVNQNIAKDNVQINNVVLFESVTVNQQDSTTSNVTISHTTEDAFEGNATQQSSNSIQGLATENRITEEITNTAVTSNKTRVTLSTTRDTSVSDTVVDQQSSQNTKTSVTLLQAEPNDQQVRPNAEVATTPTLYTIKDDDYLNQTSLLTYKSNTKTEPSAATEVLFSETITKIPNSSYVKYPIVGETSSQGAVVTKTKANSQATSVPIEGSLTQSLVVEQNTEVKETNTANKISDTATVIKTDTIAIDTKVTQIPDTSIRQPFISKDDFKQNTGSKSALPEFRKVSNITEHGHLAILETSKETIQLETVAEEQMIISDDGNNTSGNIVVPEVITTTTPRETTVIYTTQSSTNINDQKPIDPFCLSRNRGRYSDTQDCTKFYICIGKTNPIVGKCPVNTVFSETKKQCTKNKAHCVRGNEFQCISEGRFSDIMKNNAYYICIKRQNNFIRFKFQCQNEFYLNKITVRCTKQLEAISQSSTSVDNSEKNVSEGTNSKEARKGKNKKDKEDKKEDKSSEEFECKKEGNFADPDNCRKFYVCSKTKKSEFRMRRKSCDSDKLFHKDKKKCVDADSYEC